MESATTGLELLGVFGGGAGEPDQATQGDVPRGASRGGVGGERAVFVHGRHARLANLSDDIASLGLGSLGGGVQLATANNCYWSNHAA